MKSNLILMLVGALGVAALMPLPAGAQTLAQAAPNQALGPEDVFWQSVRDSDDPAMFEAYLEQVNKGVFTGTYKTLAEIKIKTLRKAAPATAPAAPPAPEPVATPPAPEPVVAPAAEPAAPAGATAAEAPPASAEAQALIESCDRAAAHPVDKLKPANIPGVTFDNLDTNAGIQTCLKATKLDGAPSRLFFQLGRVYEKLGNFKSAFEAYTEAAKRGDFMGVRNMAYTYFDGGNGIKRDRALALSLLQTALDQKIPGTLTQYGHIYLNGIGVPRDYAKARDYFQQAIDTGDGGDTRSLSDAYNDLGWIFDNGKGVKRDKNKACELWKKGMEVGNLISGKNFKKRCHWVN